MTSQTANAQTVEGFESREAFEEALIRETAFARRHEIRLALFLFEVDGLARADARTKDALAHSIRQLVATEVALAQLSDQVIGLVLRGLDPSQTHAEAERLGAAIAALPGTRLAATAGAATFHTSRAATPEALFHAAEVALLEAKKQGHGRAVVQGDGLPTPAATPPA